MSEQVISSPPKIGPMVQAERTRSVGFVIRPHLNIRICNPKYAHYKCLYSILLDCNHEVLATEREPEGQPRRARGDDEASVARSAARGATGIITRPNIAKRSKSSRTRERSGGGMTTAMAGQSWLTHSPKPRDTLPPAPSNLEGELLNLEGEQPLSQSVNSYSIGPFC